VEARFGRTIISGKNYVTHEIQTGTETTPEPDRSATGPPSAMPRQ
jgi:hypothetical protein